MNRFVKGDETLRRKKLEVMLQLEMDKNGLSLIERCLLWWLFLLLRVTSGRRYQIQDPSGMNDRTSLPPLILSDCGETFHFGGSLQSDKTIPGNYFATTAHLVSSRNCNLITRMMLSYIELGGLSRNVADVTFILAGDNENELPERALCTSRTVHATLARLPKTFVSLQERSDGTFEVATTAAFKSDRGIPSLLFKLFLVDPAVAAVEAVVRSVIEIHNPIHQNQVALAATPGLISITDNAIVDDSANDPIEKAINNIICSLEGINVPVRSNTSVTETLSGADDIAGLDIAQEYERVPILRTVSRFDILRFLIASSYNPKEALSRIVKSAIWRGSTFPVDIRTCRIELYSGQFFHQGFDLAGNPVFYFRNMCLGPWRKDEDALIAAVLHRLESTLHQMILNNPLVKLTLIVVGGKPFSRHVSCDDDYDDDTGKINTDGQSTIASTAMSTITGTLDGNEGLTDQIIEEVNDENVAAADNKNTAHSSNPRTFSDEHWNVHTSRSAIERLIHILMTNYPERLAKALVVIGHGNKVYARTAIGGVLFLPGLVPSTRTRDKVRFLTRYRDLLSHVHRTQLITLVGGTQAVDPAHYEFK